MKKRWYFWGIIFIPVIGTLLHFLYDWFPNRMIAIISPMNESLWENLKVFFWPYLLWLIIEYRRIGHKYKVYLTSKVIGLYGGLLTIIMLFYTVIGAIGRTHLIVDLAIYLFAIIFSTYLSYHNIKRKEYYIPSILSITLIIIITLAFIYFTFRTPNLPIFKEL